MKLPIFKLTPASRTELVRLMAFIQDFKPLASVQWSHGGYVTHRDGRTEPTPPRWGVGFYDVAKIPSGFVVEIEGIPFALEPDAKSMELDGQVLDFDGRGFYVRDDAA